MPGAGLDSGGLVAGVIGRFIIVRTAEFLGATVGWCRGFWHVQEVEAERSVIRHGLTDRQVGHLLDVQVQPREWNGMPLFFVLQAALPSCSSVPVCLTGWQVPFGESRTRRHTGSGGADRKVASEAEWL